jgi:hypothetical protein
MADETAEKIDVLRKKLQDLEKKAAEKVAEKAAKKAVHKVVRTAVKAPVKRTQAKTTVVVKTQGSHKKDLQRIITKISKLERRKKATLKPSVTFQTALNKLNKNMEQLFDMLSQPHEEGSHEKEVIQKLDMLLSQNEKIAQGILAIADLINEKMQPKAVEKADENLFDDDSKSMQIDMPQAETQTAAPQQININVQQPQFQMPTYQDNAFKAPADMPPTPEMGSMGVPQDLDASFNLPEAPPLPASGGLFDPPNFEFQSGKSKLFTPEPDQSIKPVQPSPQPSFWNRLTGGKPLAKQSPDAPMDAPPDQPAPPPMGSAPGKSLWDAPGGSPNWEAPSMEPVPLGKPSAPPLQQWNMPSAPQNQPIWDRSTAPMQTGSPMQPPPMDFMGRTPQDGRLKPIQSNTAPPPFSGKLKIRSFDNEQK